MSVFGDCNAVTENQNLKSCHSCGRTFNPQSLERHERICEKSNKTIRRTPFNSFLQRAKELGAIPVIPEQKEKPKCGQMTQKVMNNGMAHQKTAPPGHEQCPTCGRFFSEKSAERHLAWCREQKSRLPKTPPDNTALLRLQARTKYRAPLPAVKKSSPRLVRSADSVRDTTQHAEKRISSPESDSNVVSKANDIDGSVSKRVVKFKEVFPVENGNRNKNLDMLAALRLHLSKLSASDDFLEEFVLSPPVDAAVPRSRFCYNCGTRYPVTNAKFCCECGVQRIHPPSP